MADEEIGQATAIFLENQPDSDHPTSDTPGRGDTAIRAAYLKLRHTAPVNNLDMLGWDIEKNLQVDERAFFRGGFSALMTIRLDMEQQACDEKTDGMALRSCVSQGLTQAGGIFEEMEEHACLLHDRHKENPDILRNLAAVQSMLERARDVLHTEACLLEEDYLGITRGPSKDAANTGIENPTRRVGALEDWTSDSSLGDEGHQDVCHKSSHEDPFTSGDGGPQNDPLTQTPRGSPTVFGDYLRKIGDLEKENRLAREWHAREIRDLDLENKSVREQHAREIQDLRESLARSENREKHLEERITSELAGLRSEMSGGMRRAFGGPPGSTTAALTPGGSHNLSMEIAEVLKEQKLEEREERKAELQAVAEKEKRRDSVKFDEMKSQVRILQSNIMATYAKSPHVLSKMSNADIRSSLLTYEKEFPSKLQDLQLSMSSCTAAGALLGKENDVDLLDLQRSVAGCEAQGNLTLQSLQGVMEKRGLSKFKTDPANCKIVLPTFDGVSGHNVFTFENMLSKGLARKDVSEQDRGLWLMEALRGGALQAVKDMTSDRQNFIEASWEETFGILKAQFGDISDIRKSLLSQHASVGKILDKPTSAEWTRVAKTVSGHLALVDEAMELQRLFRAGTVQVPAINQDYVRAVMGTLTAADRMKLREEHDFSDLPLEEQLSRIQGRMEFILKNARQEAKEAPGNDPVLEKGKIALAAPALPHRKRLGLTQVGEKHFSTFSSCFICESLALVRGGTSDHRPHFFTRRGRPEKALCPDLTSLPGMKERKELLFRLDICLACLKQKVSSPSHNGAYCDALSTLPALKCREPGCRIRAIFCEQHKVGNAAILFQEKEKEKELLLTGLPVSDAAH